MAATTGDSRNRHYMGRSIFMTGTGDASVARSGLQSEESRSLGAAAEPPRQSPPPWSFSGVRVASSSPIPGYAHAGLRPDAASQAFPAQAWAPSPAAVSKRASDGARATTRLPTPDSGFNLPPPLVPHAGKREQPPLPIETVGDSAHRLPRSTERGGPNVARGDARWQQHRSYLRDPGRTYYVSPSTGQRMWGTPPASAASSRRSSASGLSLQAVQDHAAERDGGFGAAPWATSSMPSLLKSNPGKNKMSRVVGIDRLQDLDMAAVGPEAAARQLPAARSHIQGAGMGPGGAPTILAVQRDVWPGNRHTPWPHRHHIS